MMRERERAVGSFEIAFWAAMSSIIPLLAIGVMTMTNINDAKVNERINERLQPQNSATMTADAPFLNSVATVRAARQTESAARSYLRDAEARMRTAEPKILYFDLESIPAPTPRG